ncbi:Di-copper centre-containing protein [Polychaeton citri CBS 116435]|uniref:tyrosinase n=1 Tax=Polychaeton citri CBS 116435 TaxID=1314669 RepID=A0A9P4QCU2_9PEZI|nr:Di-copper centre-containing protein [Polychaeton citri CBS 116435]
MKFSSLFAAGALLGAAFTQPVENEKRQSGCLAITGVSGGVQPRLEVRQMLNTKPNQWTLFMLAMRQWMDMSQSEKTSYFQISGIHGVPRASWDGVGQCGTCSGADGYCPHDSVLFPGWHRAYLALFEQTFIGIVNSIANSYPDSSRPAMQGAAKTMRFPYWDWAAHPPSGLPTFPNVITQKTVTVNGPTGSKTFTNPLFRYDFHDQSQMYYSPFTTWSVTYRYPDSNNYGALSQTQKAVDAFANVRSTLQSQIFGLLTNCKDYKLFSNDASGSSDACPISLEGIHNTIHNTAGGPSSSTVSAGHMTYLATSAFDPVFWLHHMNVDRYFALWQGINPTVYGASQSAPGKTWTVAQGSTQNADSPLTPFHKDTSCNFWTTKQVRNTNTFGYTYPEFANSDGSVGAIKSYVNKLYGPSATATAGSSKRTAAPEPENNKKRDISSQMLKNAEGKTYEYVANLQTPRYALNGSYSIYMFLGQPQSNDTTTWTSDPNMVGVYGVLSQPGMTGMNITISGSVPLTQGLTDKLGDGLLNTLSSLHVTPFLTKALTWKIDAGGVSVDPAAIPGFQVKVSSFTATVPTSPEEFPVYGNFNLLKNVTQHKNGGFGNTLGPLPAPYVIPVIPAAEDSTVTSVIHSSTTLCPESSTAATTAPTSGAATGESSSSTTATAKTTITLRKTTTICTETPTTCESPATATA